MKKIKSVLNNVFGTNVSGDMKTSQEWYNELRIAVPSFVILDADGWNQNHYDFSFNEEVISKQHFIMRIQYSTCQCSSHAEELDKWIKDVTNGC